MSCAVGGVSEAIEPGVTGYLVASDDPADIAATVVEVLSDVEWATTARDGCSELARQRFSTIRLADDLVDLLELHQPPPVPRTSLAVAILFFNRLEATIECIESVQAEGLSVVVLDNGSAPEARRQLASFCASRPSVELISEERNVGIARGRNIILSHLHQPWILFLDNDVTVQSPDWLEKFESVLSRNREIEVFQPTLLMDDGLPEPESGDFTINGDVLEIGPPLGMRKRVNSFRGGASFVSRSLFERLGGYDERLFVGFEDFELAIRGVRNGDPIRGMLLPEIELRHRRIRAVLPEDVEAVKVRYDVDEIAKSEQIVHRKHGVSIGHGWRSWVRDRRSEALGSE